MNLKFTFKEIRISGCQELRKQQFKTQRAMGEMWGGMTQLLGSGLNIGVPLRGVRESGTGWCSGVYLNVSVAGIKPLSRALVTALLSGEVVWYCGESSQGLK